MQSISILPLSLQMNAEQLDVVRDLQGKLEQARARPYLMDDEGICRVLRVYTETKNQNIPMMRAHLEHWRKSRPSAQQRRQLDQFEQQLNDLDLGCTRVIATASEIRKGTIDRIMEMPDHGTDDADNDWPRSAGLSWDGLRLPSSITMRRFREGGAWVLAFHSERLGDLGRITCIERPDGVVELFTTGSTGPADRSSKERDAEMTKLAQLVDQFLGAAGGSVPTHGEPTAYESGSVDAKRFRCPKCDEVIELAIFAPELDSVHALQNVACSVLHHLREYDVPASIIGRPLPEDILAGHPISEIRHVTLQAWPTIGTELRLMSSSDTGKHLDALLLKHRCTKA